MQGMRAYILLERPLDTRAASKSFLDGREEHGEFFGHYADVHDGNRWSTPADARSGLLPSFLTLDLMLTGSCTLLCTLSGLATCTLHSLHRTLPDAPYKAARQSLHWLIHREMKLWLGSIF